MEQNFRMIDVGEKNITRRRAVASGSIRLCRKTIKMIIDGASPKGNILAMAEVAGILAAKNTPNLLPLCHSLPLDSVKIWFDIRDEEVQAKCEVVCHGKTGVEMEALMGLNVCLLAIYDLAKAVDPVIEIFDVHLLEKEGGKSGHWRHPKFMNLEPTTAEKDVSLRNVKFAVGTLSDRASQGGYPDGSGVLLRDFCIKRFGTEEFYRVIPDEKQHLFKLIMDSVEAQVDLLLLTGGTGLSNRDITPDVLMELASKEVVGFGELQRQFGSRFTDMAWLSRASAYVVEETLVVLFPGSPKAVQQGLECVGALLPHAVRMLRGETHHHEMKGEKK